MSPKLITTETRFSGWNRLLMATAETARGTRITRSVEDHGAAVAVLPFDPNRRVALLVRQLRVPMLVAGVDPVTLEAPAGVLDEEETEACARREAMEEAGVRLGALLPLGPVAPMPGVSTERIHLYLAAYGESDRIAEGGGLESENEEIEVVELPLAELAGLADRGELADMKTALLLERLRRLRPELFDA